MILDFSKIFSIIIPELSKGWGYWSWNKDASVIRLGVILINYTHDKITLTLLHQINKVKNALYF